MRRRHPKHWHNNPVVPVSWNPRRRKSHRRRGYRRNPVLPFFAMNPGSSVGDPVGAILARAKSLIDVSFWTDTGLPTAVGFLGSRTLGGLLHQYTLTQFAGIATTSTYYPYTKAACDALSGAALAWAAGKFYKKQAGDAVWMGTIVNVAFSLLKTLFGSQSWAPMVGLSGLGQDVSDRLKEAVTKRVQAQLGSYLTTGRLRTNTARHGMAGSYMTVDSLSPKTTFDPSPRMNLRDYDPTNDTTEL